MPGPRARFLHVANGTSTTSTIEAAGIPGLQSIWADPLYEGPVPTSLADDELIEVRRRYLSGEDGDRPSVKTGPGPSADPVNDLREWRATILRRDAYEELVLWFEHDLFDQLNLIHLLAWLGEQRPAAAPVSLVSTDSFAGRPDFKGFGELAPGELASLLETRQPINDRQHDVARSAWQAFRAPTPEALDALRHEDTSALPYLGSAISRFLQEYPWTRDGLSRTERRLLELADGDGILLSEAFPRMHDGERAYFVTDASLADMAETSSRTTPPLLRLDRDSGGGPHPLRRRIALTDAGRAVISGDLDRVSACGIDRWLGGVHLRDGARIWRWDETRQRVV